MAVGYILQVIIIFLNNKELYLTTNSFVFFAFLLIFITIILIIIGFLVSKPEKNVVDKLAEMILLTLFYCRKEQENPPFCRNSQL